MDTSSYQKPQGDHMGECWLAHIVFKSHQMIRQEVVRVAFYWSSLETNVRQVGDEQNRDLYFLSKVACDYQAANEIAIDQLFSCSIFESDRREFKPDGPRSWSSTEVYVPVSSASRSAD